MAEFFDKLDVSGSIGNFDYTLEQPDSELYTDIAQKKYEKSERKRKLVWVGFIVIVGYFAYISFKK